MNERGGPISGLRKDGTEFPAEAAISKLRIGNQTTFTVVLRDMTEWVRLERELRDARNFLENVLESATQYSMVALDLERRIVLWNEGARRNYGYSAKEIVGERADILHVPADIASGVAPSLYARALEQGTAEAILNRRRKDGSEFVARMMLFRRTGPDGSPVGYVMIGRDVTREHRRLQQERLLAAIGPLLTSSLDRAQVLSGAAELLVREFADCCIVDFADNPEAERLVYRRKIVHRDPRKAALSISLASIPLGAALEMVRTTLVSHVTPEYLDSLAGDEEHRDVLRRLALVSLVSVPLEARGLPLGALTLCSSDPRHRFQEDDVTFVEDLGRRLALALDNARLFEVATQAIQARDDLLGVVVHDLRSPLGTILLHATRLQREADPESRSRKSAAAIERAASRMNRLIQDLLEVTRVEAGRLSMKKARISTEQVISDVVDAQKVLASSVSLELRADLVPGLPDVWADRDRLHQVFENLIGNALKFTAPGGRIAVGAKPGEGEVLFWVTDTGLGIAPEELPHLFERFWQARKAGRRGAGLGLPIVKGIVEAHGGRVWAESILGRGSTFFFTIPVAPGAEDWSRDPAPRGF
jgi:PAS domain S-box-containing protein